MQGQEGNERPEGHNHEERQARHRRRLPGLQHEDVQDRESLIIPGTAEPSYRRRPPQREAFFIGRTATVQSRKEQSSRGRLLPGKAASRELAAGERGVSLTHPFSFFAANSGHVQLAPPQAATRCCIIPAMTGDQLILEAREALAHRDWVSARDRLRAARRTAPLSADDTNALGDAAWWLGLIDESIAVTEEAYRLFLASGRREDAALAAFGIAYTESSAETRPPLPVGARGR